ncbi:hypothetical protein SD78_0705 [Bacillus badius]|nr:hypothetical protein SD78_0705 [Bacillus badius]
MFKKAGCRNSQSFYEFGFLPVFYKENIELPLYFTICGGRTVSSSYLHNFFVIIK